ncbi:MAG: tRNA (adenosine(37)-N6)-dimethylallyltransferase MiaA [Lachnospiraceae bacterium]|nr:tRNA (adenosine(37)-N6)-dimethylallyltransferase MiaA [Lachnospiraceae bacterium]
MKDTHTSYNREKLHTLRPLIVLTGPTAVGKTAVSVEFAKAVQGEIISADSMQVYRGMDIGSAKIGAEEMAGVRHHLLDILEPEENFNVMLFQRLAKEKIEEIYDRSHIPILTGGTGFYIQSVLYDIAFTVETDMSVRDRLEWEALEKGAEYLHEKLTAVDPVTAENIHANNVRRVIRALEFYELNGYPLSEHNAKERQKSSPYLFRYYVLNEPRELLYEKIESRVDGMMAQGLVAEVKALKERGCTRDMVSMQGLGYKEILDYLDGVCTLEAAVDTIKKETRHFAKRQLTWFRREKEVTWVEKKNFADMWELFDFLIKDFETNIGKKL